MNKKQYFSPLTALVAIRTQGGLMEGSIQVSLFSTDDTVTNDDGSTQYSKEQTPWDDEPW